jgi:putative ABC transport system permease protein
MPSADDVVAAARALRRAPRFSALSIAVLGLGIAANVILFAVADAVLLRPFPFAHADRLVIAGESLIAPRSEISYREFAAWREQSTTFDDLAAVGSSNWTWHLRSGDESIDVRYRVVSGHYFDLLGVGAAVGRALEPADDRLESPRVVVLSDGFWRRQFAGDPAVVGRTIVLSDTPFTVVGVMPAAFRYPLDADLWTAVVPELGAIAKSIPNLPPDGGDVAVLFVVGRMKAGATLDAAQLDLNRVIAGRAQLTARHRTPEARVRLLVDDLLGSARTGLLVLFAAVAVLLAVACANVAGLLLVRSTFRAHELAVRVALGASRATLAWQLVIEAALLTIVAAAAATIAAHALLPLFIMTLPAGMPRLADAALDRRALLFAGAAAAATLCATSIVPAIRIGGDVEAVLKRSGRAVVTSALRDGARRVLIGGELAAAVVMLIAAGLLLRSVERLRHLDLGFNVSGLVAVEMSMPSEHMTDSARRRLLDRGLEEVRRIRGVRSASGVSLRPLRGPIGVDSPYQLEGEDEATAGRNPYVNTETITPSYFQTMQTRLLAGRLFDDADRTGTMPVAIVSRAFADRAWPGTSAIGKRLRVSWLDPIDPPARITWTVVGVVDDIRYRSLQARGLTIYAPFAQSPDRVNDFVVRTERLDGAAVARIHERLRALNDNHPVRIDVMADVLAAMEAPWRTNLAVLAVFATVTVAIACVGLYAMLAYAVTVRRREIGVRLVLGATPARVAYETIIDGARPIAAGVGAGVVIAVALTPLMRAILFDVAPADLLTLTAAPLLFVVVALAAAALPAHGAARTDPAISLRAE